LVSRIRDLVGALGLQACGAPENPKGAADLAPVYEPVPLAIWSWTGFYLGGHLGGGLGNTRFSDPFGGSIYGDNVSTPTFLAGGQVGYNVQAGQWVYGVELAASGVVSDGTNTCLAFSGFYVSSNCHANPNFLATATGRLGVTFGAQGHTLAYVKGGVAWINNRGDVVANNQFFGFRPQFATNFSSGRAGVVVGAGVERALAPAWSVNFEYNFMSFGNTDVATPPSTFFPPLGFIPANTTSVSSYYHVAKIGLNYRFGADPWVTWDAPRGSAYPVEAAPPPVAYGSGWQLQAGTRVWPSSGKLQWDNSAAPRPVPVNPAVLESRLTYDQLSGASGELYSRVDSPWNIFVKGNVGVGTFNGGHQNDEDWGIFGFVSYSNTLSSQNNGKLSYATTDVGYDVLRGSTYKAGAFVGYNYFSQRSDTLGCVQIATPLFPCLAPGDNRLIGTQDAAWNSLRVGVAAETLIFDSWRISGDVAYLPYVTFAGRDNHLLRSFTTFFDQSGKGRGVQLEGILSYCITPNFTVGVGARYWAMWTSNDSQFVCTGCGGPGVVGGPQFAKFSTERYGAFFQAEYKFDWGEPGYDRNAAPLGLRRASPPAADYSSSNRSGATGFDPARYPPYPNGL
jgi:opacity protein-like surface antigen